MKKYLPQAFLREAHLEPRWPCILNLPVAIAPNAPVAADARNGQTVDGSASSVESTTERWFGVRFCWVGMCFASTFGCD